jgi:hypothetical protein
MAHIKTPETDIPQSYRLRPSPYNNGVTELWLSFDPQKLPAGRLQITDFLFARERHIVDLLKSNDIDVSLSGTAWQGPAHAPKKAEISLSIDPKDVEKVLALVGISPADAAASVNHLAGLATPSARQKNIL